MFYLIVLLTAIALSLLLTPLAMRLGHRLGMVDRPGGRRKHRGVIPRTGGLALYAAFLLTVLLTIGLPYLLPAAVEQDWLPPRNDPDEVRRLLALLAGLTFCVVCGFLDDRYEFSSLPQYAVQLIAAFRRHNMGDPGFDETDAGLMPGPIIILLKVLSMGTDIHVKNRCIQRGLAVFFSQRGFFDGIGTANR